MLRQLSGMDSLFLYAENRRTPLEVGCLQIYDPSTAPGGRVDFATMLATFRARLDRCAVFHQRLVEVPLGLDHPYWVPDDEFRLDDHVRHLSLPKPGDWNQLMAQVAHLHACPLDHTKPLWLAAVIEGLDDIQGIPKGGFAVYMKFHHSAIDGVTGDEVLTAMHDTVPCPTGEPHARPLLRQHIESSPSPWKLIARAPLNATLGTTRLGIAMARGLRDWLRGGLPLPDLNWPTVPATAINARRASAERSIGGRYFDLDDFESIRREVPGATVNDVALTVVAGALRHYLEATDSLPVATMVAACPINVGTADDARIGRGNLLGVMLSPLHTDVANPVERLHAIQASTNSAKSHEEKHGKMMLTRIPLNLPAPVTRNLVPVLLLLAAQARLMPFNTIVSNVAMAHGPLYFAGAKLVRVLATGPVVDRAGLFHTVFSYDGMMSIAFTACRDMLPDPAAYAGCIGESFSELKQAARIHRAIN